MAVVLVIYFTSLVAAWLSIHLVAQCKLRSLHTSLSAAYQSAIAVPPFDVEDAPLIALAIDLMRKEHCQLPFDALDEAEQRVALHAHAVETLPQWVVSIAKQSLPKSERTLITQLQSINTSRPHRKPTHFGAINQQLQLRSASKT